MPKVRLISRKKIRQAKRVTAISMFVLPGAVPINKKKSEAKQKALEWLRLGQAEFETIESESWTRPQVVTQKIRRNDSKQKRNCSAKGGINSRHHFLGKMLRSVRFSRSSLEKEYLVDGSRERNHGHLLLWPKDFGSQRLGVHCCRGRREERHDNGI